MRTQSKLNHKTITVGLSIVNNRNIRKLNRSFRQEDIPTDVLSFNIDEKLGRGVYFLGDVVVSLDQIKKQASQYKVSEAQELARVIVHGILHLLGYNDKSQEEKKMMRQAEDKVLRRIDKCW